MNRNNDTTKDYHKVKKVEFGNYGYDTVFISVEGEEIQVPIKNGIYKMDEIVGKRIKIITGNTIEKVDVIN